MAGVPRTVKITHRQFETGVLKDGRGVYAIDDVNDMND